MIYLRCCSLLYEQQETLFSVVAADVTLYVTTRVMRVPRHHISYVEKKWRNQQKAEDTDLFLRQSVAKLEQQEP